ncbi:MAG TPA: hypothetical protein VJ862_04910 [Rhodanobacteraceae bacterium]|nr:hypothetical protein [Rhodanobacteraceae bacterium]
MDPVLNDDEFYRWLQKRRQSVVLAIKAHFFIDSLMAGFLTVVMPRADALEIDRLSFLLKFDLISGMGLIAKEFRPLFEQINRIRNKFAHDPNYKFRAQDRDAFIQVMFSFPVRIVPEHIKKEKSCLESFRTLCLLAHVHMMLAIERMYRQRLGMAISLKVLEDAKTGKRGSMRPGGTTPSQYAKWLENWMVEKNPCVASGKVVFNLELPD